MHNRSAIRAALAALIGPAIAPAQLLIERQQRIDSSLRPLCILSLGEDAIDIGQTAMGNPSFEVEHGQAVTVEIHTEGASGDVAAEAIDALELLVEGAIASDLKLGGLVEMMTPVSSEMEMQTDQDRVIAVRSIDYLASWRSNFGTPDIPES